MTLTRARILVADDQRDVAVTLTSGLREAGATLTFVTNGEAALQQIRAGGIDAVLLDMKMPPDNWGGLWVLDQMRSLELSVPVIVLSGEGGQHQTIEAMRLGARDWVDKGAAGRELPERCVALLDAAHAEALTLGARTLPSPVAHAFARLAVAPIADRTASDAFRALESVVRFAALVALADRAKGSRGIPGVQSAQFARPSFGTWVSVARGLVAQGDQESPASTWLAALLPERKSVRTVQDLTTLRNDIAHGGKEPTDTELETLRTCLVDVAHRLSTGWEWRLHTATSMEYDGVQFRVRTKLHSGTSAPTASAFTSPSPVRTGEVALVKPDGRFLLLAPWLMMVDAADRDAVGMYDSAPIPRHDTGIDTALEYTDPASRLRGLFARGTDATWAQIRHQVNG